MFNSTVHNYSTNDELSALHHCVKHWPCNLLGKKVIVHSITSLCCSCRHINHARSHLTKSKEKYYLSKRPEWFPKNGTCAFPTLQFALSVASQKGRVLIQADHIPYDNYIFYNCDWPRYCCSPSLLSSFLSSSDLLE